MWFEKAKELINATRGDISFLVKNLNTGEFFSHREDEVFPSASIIKVPILIALLEGAREGLFDLNKSYHIGDERIVGGCGIILYLSDLPYTLMDYATLMIDLSDNTATNKLIDIVGIDTISAKNREIGLLDTVLERKLMHLEGANKHKRNLTSPRDMLKLFEWIYKDCEKHEIALKLLKQQLLNDLLPAFTKKDYEFAHKTGEISGVRHDTGIMYLKDPVFVAFMSKNLSDEFEGVKLANDLGRMVVEEFS